MKSKSRKNKLVLNKRIIANLNTMDMFHLKGGEDPLKKTDPKICLKTKELKVCQLLETHDPTICKPVPTDFGIPTHD